MGLRTVLAIQLLPALEACERSGNRLDSHLLPSCFSYGVPSPTERLPEKLLCTLWDQAAALSGAPDFGLSAGEQFMSARSFGITGLVSWHSETAGAALQNASRYATLVVDGSPLNFERSGEVVSLSGSDDLRPEYWSRHYGEAKMMAFLSFLRRSTQLSFDPKLVEFRHAPGMAQAQYEEIFGCSVRFSCERDRLVLPASIFSAPLKTYDPKYCESLSALAELRLGGPSGGVRELVRQHHRQRFERHLEWLLSPTAEPLPCHVSSLVEVAKELGVSGRTVQRHLEQEGTSFHEELDAAREDVALPAVARTHIALHKVSLATGFSDDKAFRKHFCEWAKVLPSVYRRNLRGENTVS